MEPTHFITVVNPWKNDENDKSKEETILLDGILIYVIQLDHSYFNTSVIVFWYN